MKIRYYKNVIEHGLQYEQWLDVFCLFKIPSILISEQHLQKHFTEMKFGLIHSASQNSLHFERVSSVNCFKIFSEDFHNFW